MTTHSPAKTNKCSTELHTAVAATVTCRRCVRENDQTSRPKPDFARIAPPKKGPQVIARGLNLSQSLSLDLNQNGYGIPGLRERAYKDAVQVAGPTSVPRVKQISFMQDPRMKVSSVLFVGVVLIMFVHYRFNQNTVYKKCGCLAFFKSCFCFQNGVVFCLGVL